MGIRHQLGFVMLAAALLLAGTSEARAQGSDKVVKATAKAEKPDASGNQVIAITLDIDPKYHIYANPVGNEDFESNQTKVTLGTKGKAQLVKVDYPAGEVVKDKVVGDYRKYKGKVTVRATVKRTAGDPVEFAIKLQACSSTACLPPGTLKISVP